MPQDDPYVIQLVGGVEGIERFPELVENIGRYVVRYEPELSRKGERWLWTTDDLNEALTFANAQQVHETYLASIGKRPDGRPDRPLTVFHVSIARRSKFAKENA